MILSGCNQQTEPGIVSTSSVPARNFSIEKVTLGKKVYDKYCVGCHGLDGVGDKNWRKRDSNGMFPPPPLNGSGHSWHHPVGALKNQIVRGGKENGGAMPAFGDKLGDQEVDAVIIWIQSIWPKKIYEAWYEMQQQ